MKTNATNVTPLLLELFCVEPSTNFTDDELLFVCQSYKYGHSCAIGCMNGKSLTTTSTSSIVCEANFTSTPPTMYWDKLNKTSPEFEGMLIRYKHAVHLTIYTVCNIS